MTHPDKTRAVNDLLSARAPNADVLALVCECGATRCRSLLQLPASDYGEIRRQPGCFLAVPEHVEDALFEVVRRWPGVVLVRARRGGA